MGKAEESIERRPPTLENGSHWAACETIRPSRDEEALHVASHDADAADERNGARGHEKGAG